VQLVMSGWTSSSFSHASAANCVLGSVYGCRMGGDRDGNPFVTPQTTRDVVITSRLAATNLYFTAVEKLMYELSVWRCSDELKVRPHSNAFPKQSSCRIHVGQPTDRCCRRLHHGS